MTYVFGSSEGERLRLQEQADLLRRLSISFLRETNIKPGMRVLDLGCGVGDFSFLLRELVGVDGCVTGVDLDLSAIACARSRARKRRFQNVHFVAADVRALPSTSAYDAVVGRFILAYLGNLEDVMLLIGGTVKPRGIVAFQEWDHSRKPWAIPCLQVFEEINRRVIEILGVAGVNLSMAASLNQALRQSRFYLPRFFVQTYVAAGPKPVLARYILDTLHNLECALGRPRGLEIIELQRRFVREQRRARAILSLSPLVGVWTRVRG